MFIRMEVTRPAMLFRKVGQPQVTICRRVRSSNRGRTKRSRALPRTKGMKDSTTQMNMPSDAPKAAAHSPRSSTPRNTNSKVTHSTDIRMLMHMLPRM